MSEQGERIGCGDSLCEFGHPPGMHTNGGCQCFKIYGLDQEQRAQLMRIKRFVKLQRERIAELEQLRPRAARLEEFLVSLDGLFETIASHEPTGQGVPISLQDFASGLHTQMIKLLWGDPNDALDGEKQEAGS